MSVASPDRRWRTGRGIIVRPNVERTEVIETALGAVILVDPESIEGLWLRSALSADITVVPEWRLRKCVEEWRIFIERPFESMEIGALIRQCVHSLCPGAPPARRLGPRVTLVLQAIRLSDELRISLESAASRACLSAGPLRASFQATRRAAISPLPALAQVDACGHGHRTGDTAASAAQAADFSDAAHLTRTSYAMLGVPPSAMKGSEFY